MNPPNYSSSVRPTKCTASVFSVKPNWLSLKFIRACALALIAAVAIGFVGLVEAAVGPGPGPTLPSTYLEGSLDLGDLGYDWRAEINIEGTEKLVFRWKTNEHDAVFGRYAVTDEDGAVLQVADLATAPPPGEYRIFFIQCANLIPKDSYKVRVQALSRTKEMLGDPSSPVIVNRVCPGPVTQFTDSGLNLPILHGS
jgi:hypothetical protein